jgi:hypothetical protein
MKQSLTKRQLEKAEITQTTKTTASRGGDSSNCFSLERWTNCMFMNPTK